MLKNVSTILKLAAVAEGSTGLILLADPSLVVRLLFGGEITGAGNTMSRLAGCALLGLAIACWPGAGIRQAFYGMVTYSVLAMLLLTYIGAQAASVGPLLWPGVAVHAVMIVLLTGAWWKKTRGPTT